MRFLLLVAAALAGADWPRFRGPNGAGIAPAENLPAEFSPSRNVLWKAAVPFGRSSPIVFNQRIFLTASEGNKLLTLAFDARSGKPLWRREIAKSSSKEIYKANDPASPTPTADENGVYAFFPDFGVIAFSHAGRELWRHPLPEFHNFYGMSSSPVAAAGQVILQCDQSRGSYLLSLDTKTGKQRWRRDRPGYQEGWSTPVVYQDQLVVFGTHRVDGLHLSTGEPRWSFPLISNGSTGSPVIHNGTVIVTAAGMDQPWLPSFASVREKVDSDKNGLLTKAEAKDEKDWFEFFGGFDLNTDGNVDEKEWDMARSFGVGDYGAVAIPLDGNGALDRSAAKWRVKRSLPYVPAPLLYEGVFYMTRDGGIISSIDPGTGEILKQGRTDKAKGQYLASPVAADGKLFIASEEGILTVLKAGAQWEILSVNNLEDECFATPAINGSQLIVRTRGSLYAFGTSR